MNHPGRLGAVSLLAAAMFALVPVPAAQAEAVELAHKQSADKKPAASCDRANFRIILDVGHSAEVPGALSSRGVGEYTFNLRLAQTIEKKLTAAGFAKTHLLITPGKAIAGLVQRVHFANRSPADLFLSIHHDAAPDKFLEKWTYDGKERPYCDRFKGHSIFVSQHNEHYKTSLQFARLLGVQLKSQGLKYAPHYVEKFMGIRQRQLVDPDTGVYRFDNLVVLMSNNMPAVLFEAGSIINRDEELIMADPQHQAMLATSVTAAVESFCAAQSPRKHEPKPEPRTARRTAANEQPRSPQLFPAFDPTH